MGNCSTSKGSPAPLASSTLGSGWAPPRRARWYSLMAPTFDPRRTPSSWRAPQHKKILQMQYFFGGWGGDRTRDSRLMSPVLYQLSYPASVTEREGIYQGRLDLARCFCYATVAFPPVCRGGGMVYATDSKSVPRKGLRVRVPPAAPIKLPIAGVLLCRGSTPTIWRA